jgi:hypothetical protein
MLSAHKTDDSIITLQPGDKTYAAVFSDKPAETVSSKYVMVPTHQFIPIAQEAEWDLLNSGSKKRNRRTLGKNPEGQSTAGHFLAFRPSDQWIEKRGLASALRFDGKIGRISNAVPRLVLYNSHDCTLALKAVLGIFEFICSNAAIVTSDEWGSWSFRHMNVNPAKLLNFFRSVLEVAPYILDTRDYLSKIDVTRNQALELAESVIDLRWDGEKYAVDPNELIIPRHQEQSALTAYNVFQTIQGYLVQGGNQVGNKTKQKNRKASKIKNFAADLAINRGLWERTNKWLGGMGYQLPAPPVINVNVR